LKCGSENFQEIREGGRGIAQERVHPKEERGSRRSPPLLIHYHPAIISAMMSTRT